jgi:hypothetical protein
MMSAWICLDMNTPFHPLRAVSLAAAVAVLAAAAVFGLAPSLAQAKTTSTGAVLVAFKVAQKTGAAPTDNSGGLALPTGKGAGGSTLNMDATNAQTWLEITVENVGEGDIAGLTINYHVFSKTTTESKTMSIAMADVSGSQQVDIPYGRQVVVKTTPISKQIDNGTSAKSKGTSSSSAKSSKGKSSAAQSSTVTDIAGWYIEAVSSDQPSKPVKSEEHPTGIIQQYETLQAQVSK